MTAQQLAQHFMAQRGLNTAVKKLVKFIAKRVGACLRHHRSQRSLRSFQDESARLLWEVAG